MFGILLRMLSMLGWLLLAVLMLVLITFLLVLFYPISYQLEWERSNEEMFFKAKAHWLLGILQLRFIYPTPGKLAVKFLGFTVYDETRSPKPAKKQSDKASSNESQEKKETSHKDSFAPSKEACKEEESSSNQIFEESKPGIPDRIRKIMENLIDKIRQIYDKIIHIKEDIQYYVALLKEEDSQLLFTSVLFRSGKIIKSIRPRKIKGQIVLGTGSPDTTGYTMAVYGILSPYLGQNLILTPNFEEKILEGQLYVKGRIKVVTLLVHGLKVGLDRRLRSFIKKLKREVV